MEEDIKVLEELIEDYELNREIVCVKDIQAIKNLIARNKELEEIKNTAINFNETLREEIKRFRKDNKNTIIITVSVDNIIYEVDTQIENKWNLKENNYYYLADSYKEPSKVKFIEWTGNNSVDNKYLIFCACYKDSKIEYYHPSSLYKTKEKASEAYLKSKNY